MQPSAQPFPDVLEEHWDDLDFLIMQREDIVFDKDYTLPELAEFEERIEAHLDGVRIAGLAGLSGARKVLEEGSEDGAVQAAVRLLAEDESNDDLLIEALRDGPSMVVARGLRHAPGCVDRLAGALSTCASEGPEPAAQAAARDVLAFHRKPAPMPAAALWTDDDPDVRTSTWQSAARLNALNARHIETALAESEPAVRDAALRALAHAAAPGLLDALRKAAFLGTDEGGLDPVAVRLLGSLRSLGDLDALLGAAASQAEPTEPSIAVRVAALEALGALGSTAGLARLAEATDDEAARAAGLDGWSRITGLELDPETTTRPQLERAEKAWLEDKDGSAFWQDGIEVPTGNWSDLAGLSLRSRRDLYAANRLASSAGDLELEAPARLQARR